MIPIVFLCTFHAQWLWAAMSSKWLISTFSVSVYCLTSMQLCLGCTQTLGCDQGFYQMTLQPPGLWWLVPAPPSIHIWSPFSSFNGFNLTSAHFQVFKIWISSWDTSRLPFPSALWPVPQKGVVLQGRQGGQHAVPHQAQKLLLEDLPERCRRASVTATLSPPWPLFPLLPLILQLEGKGRSHWRESWREKWKGLFSGPRTSSGDLLVLWQLLKSPGTVLGHPVWTRVRLGCRTSSVCLTSHSYMRWGRLVSHICGKSVKQWVLLPYRFRHHVTHRWMCGDTHMHIYPRICMYASDDEYTTQPISNGTELLITKMQNIEVVLWSGRMRIH